MLPKFDGKVCECESPVPHFTLHTTQGDIKHEQRYALKMTEETIDQTGLNEIRNKLWVELRPETGGWRAEDKAYEKMYLLMDNVEPTWQAERGTYPKRLSAAFHKAGINLTPQLLELIGNIARKHHRVPSTRYIEFTRQLNNSADYFATPGSCWWTTRTSPRGFGFAHNRCGLKNWGGLAMRLFKSETEAKPVGRAWILPIGVDLLPSHDVNGPGLIVLNGYDRSEYDYKTGMPTTEPFGTLEGAQIMSHLTGRTFKVVHFKNTMDEWEVSGMIGYFVAVPELLEKATSFNMDYDHHHQFDAANFLEVVKAAPVRVRGVTKKAA